MLKGVMLARMESLSVLHCCVLLCLTLYYGRSGVWLLEAAVIVAESAKFIRQTEELTWNFN